MVISYILWCVFFFFKQKTAYEMRISDWSSDVCSSDLFDRFLRERIGEAGNPALRAKIQALERDVVEAGEQDIAIAERVAEIGEAARVGRRFLDRDDIFDIDQRLEHGLVDHRAIGRRVVIERSEEHTSELQSLMRNSYAVLCLK